MDHDEQAAPAPPAAGATAVPATAPAPRRGPDEPGPLEAFATGAAYAVLALLGAALGVVGSFLQGFGPAFLAVAVLIAANAALAWLAAWGMGSRLGGIVPAAAWLAVVLVLSRQRPEGDLVVPGTTSGYVFLIGGMVALAVGLATSPVGPREPGGWLTRGAPPTGG
ncbi:DUF6113 family protein [Actinomadura parmotrematis]|uniref:Integral membrane protein n=1 Tax=Actinomadura parmotrematis TaxID=2864039 RepID=A0ABS7FPH1_9ACTN|nr:DUF6113 family protein [Actinomadura parmotrematis]MBW8481463.1 hypothetical protein [Actinomadura parmotrematis]